MARFTGVGGGGGAPGPQGPTGPQGDSAYDVAVANGFVGTEQEWLDSLGGGGSANIADFIFTDDTENAQSIISLPGDKQMRIEAGADSDLYLTAGDDLWIQTLGTGDDIHINAADDIRFSAGNENAEFGTVYSWRMDSEGNFQLPGDGYISNPIDSSGDPSTPFVDTIHLVPDGSLGSNQYIILDPTAPNHIHIRAGGNMDESSADLILGGEKNNVVVSDSSRDVYINTRPDMVINSYTNLNEVPGINFIVDSVADIDLGYTVNVDGTEYLVDSVTPYGETIIVTATGASFTAGQSYTFFYNPEYTNSWEFASNGTLFGPAEGALKVLGISNQGEEQNIFVTSGDKVLLNGANGEFLNDTTNPSNQIATIGDIDNTVSNSMVRYSPAFTATGLTFTGSGSTHPTYNSYYVKSGKMVSFVIEVDCSTVTNFGTGQYKVELPFPPAIGYNHFSGWAQIDTAVNPDVPNGHVILNVDHAGLTSTLDLHYLKQAGGAHTPIIEGLFLQGTPVTLTTSSKIYINGTYICQ